MIKKINWNFTFIFLILLFPLSVFSWGFQGHVLVGEIAYENLTPHVKLIIDRDAAALFSQLPASQQSELNSKYQNVSVFAKTLVLADIWRNWQLHTVFEKCNTATPLALEFSLITKLLHGIL